MRYLTVSTRVHYTVRIDKYVSPIAERAENCTSAYVRN